MGDSSLDLPVLSPVFAYNPVTLDKLLSVGKVAAKPCMLSTRDSVCFEFLE